MKFGWRGVLGLVISAACLYLAFRNVQWSDALEHARTANYWLLLLAAACATGMFRRPKRTPSAARCSSTARTTRSGRGRG